MDMKHSRERISPLPFFINILILERGSGMKSFSNFILERKKGNTAVASPAPGDRDPLDLSNRKKIDKKFSDPSNPPKVANPEAPKTPKTTAVKQADVSKQAAKFRSAQRVKGATGGKTTGSLARGTLSFPGDRSGATARVKSDIAARRGFSGSKSGGLKADESNPNVDRSVRQKRTVKQGIPDPFKSKIPAPARPFKNVTKRAKSGKPSIPDPFPGTPVKTVPQTPANEYIRSMQDQGRKVTQDFVDAQGLKASGAKPEMVGRSSTKGQRTRFRAQADATRDISKTRGADLDKVIKNLVGNDVKKSNRSGYSFKNKPKPGSEVTLARGNKSFIKSVGGLSVGKTTSSQKALSKKNFKSLVNPKNSVIDVEPVKVKDITPEKNLLKGKPTPVTQKTIDKAVERNLGKYAGKAAKGLGAVGAGLDTFLDYRKNRASGDSRLKAGLKSGFRTAAGWLGGAVGSSLGSFAGPVGTIGGGVAGYTAGTSLADKVLSRLRKKPKKK